MDPLPKWQEVIYFLLLVLAFFKQDSAYVATGFFLGWNIFFSFCFVRVWRTFQFQSSCFASAPPCRGLDIRPDRRALFHGNVGNP